MQPGLEWRESIAESTNRTDEAVLAPLKSRPTSSVI